MALNLNLRHFPEKDYVVKSKNAQNLVVKINGIISIDENFNFSNFLSGISVEFLEEIRKRLFVNL
jgi:hypothetical protein